MLQTITKLDKTRIIIGKFEKMNAQMVMVLFYAEFYISFSISGQTTCAAFPNPSSGRRSEVLNANYWVGQCPWAGSEGSLTTYS